VNDWLTIASIIGAITRLSVAGYLLAGLLGIVH